MVIGKEFKKILEDNRENVICSKMLELSKNNKWVNGISYVNVAIVDSCKISYVTKDRVGLFKKKNNNFAEITSIDKLKIGDVLIQKEFSKPEFVIIEVMTDRIKTMDGNGFPYTFGVHDFCNLFVLKSKPRSLKQILFKNDLRVKLAYMTTPGKFVNKLCLSFGNNEIDSFSRIFSGNMIAAEIAGYTFKVFKGDDIKWAYSEDNYLNLGGSLGSSCMRHGECQEFFGIYIENPEIVSILALMKDGKVTGRALLWKIRHGGEQVTLMDRVYVNNDSDTGLFYAYAENSGFYRKEYNNASSKTNVITCEKAYLYIKFDVKLDNYGFDRYPYMDTFTYLDSNTGIIRNYETGYYGEYTLESTNGYYSNNDEDDENWVYSNLENSNIPSDESVYSDYMDDYIYERNALYDVYGVDGCIHEDHVDVVCLNGSYYHKEHDEVVWDEINNEYIHIDDSVVLIDEQTTNVNEAVYSEYSNGYILRIDAIEVDSEWVHENDYNEYIESRREFA